MKPTFAKALVAVSLVCRSTLEDAPTEATRSGSDPVTPPPSPPVPTVRLAQKPPEQTLLAPHAAPHAPQWRLLSERLTHWLPHALWPAGHLHAPCEQTWLAP